MEGRYKLNLRMGLRWTHPGRFELIDMGPGQPEGEGASDMDAEGTPEV